MELPTEDTTRFNVAEAAAYLGCSISELRKLINHCKICSYKVRLKDYV